MYKASRSKFGMVVLGMLVMVVLGPSLTFASADDSSSRSNLYSISWYSMDGGGGAASGEDYRVFGSIGQSDAGRLTGGGFAVTGGFVVPRERLVSAIVLSTDVAPTVLPEPGGTAVVTLTVLNSGETLVDLTGLRDDDGSLAGLGSCSLPQSLEAGERYDCSFEATVAGNAEDLFSRTVTAEADGPLETAMSEDTFTVSLSDVLPNIGLIKMASPTEMPAPGGPVAFSVRVTNIGGAEPVNLLMLTDDIHGDLDGRGTCAVPQTLPVSGMYSCEFSTEVTGPPGFVEVNTITAIATDDEGNQDSASDTATVTLSDALTDIAINKTDGRVWVAPEDMLTYTLRVDNLGPETVASLLVSDPLPVSLVACHWDCVDDSGTCGSGSGDVSALIDLTVGEQAVFTVDCEVTADASGILTNTAEVMVPAGFMDTDPSNNLAADLTRIGDPFFWDGFESGDLDAWTSSLGFERRDER